LKYGLKNGLKNGLKKEFTAEICPAWKSGLSKGKKGSKPVPRMPGSEVIPELKRTWFWPNPPRPEPVLF
jgi:hypothetical protein